MPNNRRLTDHLRTSATLLMAGAILSACVTTAKTQRYYPANADSPWQIDGDMKGLTGELQIRINGEGVMQGKFPALAKQYSMSGRYNSKPVKAECELVYCTNSVACYVYIDQEPAALLEFGKP